MRTGTAKAKDANNQSPAHNEIVALAFEYWEMRAGVGGSAENDWLRAEQALRERLSNTQDYRSSTSVGGDLNQFNPRSRTAG